MGRQFAWVAPAAAGAAVTIFLAWGAWVSAADRAWLHASTAWWRAALLPGNFRVPLIFAALWLLDQARATCAHVMIGQPSSS